MNSKIAVKLNLLIILFGITFALPFSNNDEFTLQILHTNDMHSRYEQTSVYSSECNAKYAAEGKCYGGFARLATLIRETKKLNNATIFLNAGDNYQGSTWFSVHKWKIVSRFLNILQPDAISLGNHEFDYHPEGLAPFLNNASFPILAANLDFSQEPILAKTPVKKSIILNVNGHKIGIIGYLTPETKSIAYPEKVVFLDEITEIQKEVRNLQKEGVKIIIALGHSGYKADQKIAEEVDDIDLVIGGHSHTFLYTGEKPDLEKPEGPYPTEIIQKNGRKVYVVQAYAFTKYVGNLSIDFDKEGEIKRIEGAPILMNNKIKEADDILAELEVWRPEVDAFSKQEVGSSKVFLDGDSKSCRRQECNFGNLLTDAMIDYNSRKYVGNDKWTDAPIAFLTSGDIRASIEKSSNDKIIMSKVLAALPYNNIIAKIEIPGKTLLQVLERSVFTLKEGDTSDLHGAFLQFSGIQVTYDLSKPSGSRVVSVSIRCSECNVPHFEKLEKEKNYTALTSDYAREGGDGYTMLSDLKWSVAADTPRDILLDYLKIHSPIHPQVEWRINFVSHKEKHVNNVSTGNIGTRISYYTILFPIILSWYILRDV